MWMCIWSSDDSAMDCMFVKAMLYSRAVHRLLCISSASSLVYVNRRFDIPLWT